MTRSPQDRINDIRAAVDAIRSFEQFGESHIENRTPGAWRIWWQYAPTPDTLTNLTLAKDRGTPAATHQ